VHHPKPNLVPNASHAICCAHQALLAFQRPDLVMLVVQVVLVDQEGPHPEARAGLIVPEDLAVPPQLALALGSAMG